MLQNVYMSFSELVTSFALRMFISVTLCIFKINFKILLTYTEWRSKTYNERVIINILVLFLHIETRLLLIDQRTLG